MYLKIFEAIHHCEGIVRLELVFKGYGLKFTLL